ncbi:capsule-associated protein CAP1, partial [Nowakowskiella sp. JEL0078]
LPDMEMFINELDEPRILFNPKKEMQQNPEAVRWDMPSDADHYDYMLKHCEVQNRLNGPILNNFHGFTINPDTKYYTNDILPLFSESKLSACFADIIVPSNYYFRKENNMVDSVSWKDKKPVMFWRGSTTGGKSFSQSYVNYHRQRLVNITSNSTNYDVAFTAAIQCLQPICEEMKKKYRFTQRVLFKDMMSYKYLIDVDGNTFSQRYTSFLKSNSLVFKMTLFDEYFDGWLKPFVHYIPVSIDFSDLEEKLKWAMENDDEAQQITLNAQLFTKRFLTQGQMECYLYLTLLEIARLGNEER